MCQHIHVSVLIGLATLAHICEMHYEMHYVKDI